MPLTLPANMQTDKNKQGHSPTLFIEFTDLTYYLATEDFTLDLTLGGTRAYTDLTKAGASIGTISQTVPADMNRNASTASLDITLVDYRGSLRSNIIGSSPNLTASAVDIYLIFETTNDEADRLQIFSGYIADYTIQRDVMTLKIETDAFKDLGDFPQQSQTLVDAYDYSTAEKNIVEPLQYGDFDWSTEPVWFGNKSSKIYAICPYIGETSGQKAFSVASHEMKEFPSTSGEVNDDRDSYLFSWRGAWVHHNLTDITTTNTSGGCSFWGDPDVDWIDASHVYVWPGAVFTSGENANNADGPLSQAIDGKVATVCQVTRDAGAAYANFDTFPIGDNLRYNTTDHAAGTARGATFSIYVTGTTHPSPPGNVGTFKIKKKSDHSLLAEANVSSTASGWTTVAGFGSSFDILTINDYYIELASAGVNYGYNVSGIALKVPVERWSIDNGDEACLYARCQGRAYSGTWGSRKTSGNLITHPIDMIESIWRDDFGKTAIDTDSFDNVAGVFSSYVVNASIFERETAEAFFDRFAEQFNVTNIISQNNIISIAAPSDTLNYSASGTTSPDDEDILTDNETITSESFNEHPIKKGSFQITRTPKSGLIGKLTMPYGRRFDGEYMIINNTSGTGTGTTINNDFLGHATTAASLVAFVRTWRSNQRFIASMTTFLNAIGWQIGDIRSVVHDDLVDAMMYDSVEGDKWIVFSIRINGTKGLIDLKLQNIPT